MVTSVKCVAYSGKYPDTSQLVIQSARAGHCCDVNARVSQMLNSGMELAGSFVERFGYTRARSSPLARPLREVVGLH